MAGRLHVVWIFWGPLEKGEPHSRTRVFYFGHSMQRLKWIGPETQAGIQKEFEELFARRVVADGDMYLTAHPNLLKKFYRAKFAARHIHFNSLEDVPTAGEDVCEMLTPAQRQRKDAYTLIREVEHPDSCFLGDLEQWPNQASSCGRTFPCQLKHGCMWSWQLQREALGLEHLAAQGVHLLNSMQSRYTSPMQQFFEGLGDNCTKSLSGNGMCLTALSSWVVYVFSNLVRVESSKLLEEHSLASLADVCEQGSEADPD